VSRRGSIKNFIRKEKHIKELAVVALILAVVALILTVVALILAVVALILAVVAPIAWQAKEGTQLSVCLSVCLSVVRSQLGFTWSVADPC
jgi:hypothetical protein